ncbi:MAG TPA: ABC transporter permease [Vicinamibacterales bacterium]|nr:ABC transporter permease [Vicinamibacterales bacterium]
MAEWWRDARIGLRLLRRQPGFAAAAMLILALGIGANTAVFSAVHAILLDPLPYPQSDGLLRVGQTQVFGLARGPSVITNETFHAWLAGTKTLEGLGAYAPRAYTLVGHGEARRLQGAAVSAALLSLLRARPAQGRLFTSADERPPNDRVVLLSHSLWQTLFAGDRTVPGRTIVLDGLPHTIVGVMPPDFYFPDRDAAVWTPLVVPEPSRSAHERSVFVFPALARLRPGVTLEQARAEGETIVRRIAAERRGPLTPLDRGGAPALRLVPLKDDLVRDIRPALLVITAAVALLMLVATANLAGVVLARGLARQREMAVRAAVGAGPWRLARQLLIENVMLAGAAAVFGVALAWWIVRLAPSLVPQGIPRLDEIAVDWPVLAFATGLALVVGTLVGLAPALHARRADVVRAMAGVEGGTPGWRAGRLRLALAVVQIATALLLLVGAGLLAKSFAALVRVDPGYDPSNVLTARLSFAGPRYAGGAVAFIDALLERLRGQPDVEVAAASSLLPLTPGNMVVSFDLPGRDPSQGPATASVRIVTADYLRATGLRLLEGRWLADTDRAGSRPVMVVNRAFVRAYGGGERLVGRSWRVFRQPHEIVGVVGDVRHAGLDADPVPEVYVTYAQSADIPARGTFIVLRARRDPLGLVPVLREAVRSLDPELPLENVATMEARLEASVARPRFYAALVGALAVLAGLVACTGVYGVFAQIVAQRRREFGVRLALGADRGDILRLVLLRGLAVVAAGLSLGLLAAAGTMRLLRGLLFGVTAGDPSVYAAVALLLGVLALAACYAPARRAARVQPADVLRQE